MAFNDTLFQLGMDLTRSSTAQKEDYSVSALDTQEDCHGTSSLSANVPVASKHILIDLTGAKRCETAKMAEKALRQAFDAVLGKVEAVAVRRSQKGRCLSGSASIAGGEVKMEAWPETGYVAIDIFGANSLRPELVMSHLMDAFGAREAMVKRQRSASEVARLTKSVRWVGQGTVTRATTRSAADRPAKSRRAA